MQAQRHHVGPPARILDEAGPELRQELLVRDGTARKLRLGEAGETARADEVDLAAGRIGLDEVAGVVARHRAGVASTVT